jgi:hypothetical protein
MPGDSDERWRLGGHALAMLRAGTSRLWTLSATFSFSFFVSRLCEHVHGSIDAHNGVDESVSEQNGAKLPREA